MTCRVLRVALPWHSPGHGNLGVDALTRANIAIVEAAAARIGREASIITLCGAGNAASADLPPNVTIGPRPRLKPLLRGQSDYLAVLKGCDVVLDIGEGDSWADIYGPTRFAFQAGTKTAAIALGKPLILAPQTIGPFDHRLTRFISDAVMQRARAVFTRDHLSSAYLAERGLRCETAEFIDVAFRLPFTAQPRTADPARPRVGLNVSGLLYNGGYTGRNELGMALDYAAYTHALIAALLERGCEVHLVPHVTSADGGNDDDLAIITALRERFPALHLPARFADSREAKGFISGLDFFVGGRMHACIAAFSSGTPVVPIAYSRKFNGLFGTLGYDHFVDGKALDTGAALARTLDAFAARERLAQDMQPGLALATGRLEAYEQRLAAVFAEVA